MDNEELALLIQAGHTEHYGELWTNCRRLLRYLLTRYQNGITLPNYISGEDLEQCMYAALREAVKAYDNSKGYKFNTYLRYHVINAVKAQLPDSGIIETSGNVAVNDADGDNRELFDYIPDEIAAVPFENIERRDLCATVRRAVSELPKDSRECISLYYFHDKTQRQIAALTGRTVESVRGALRRGLRLLRNDKRLCALVY